MLALAPSSSVLDAAVNNLSESPVFLATALSHMKDGRLRDVAYLPIWDSYVVYTLTYPVPSLPAAHEMLPVESKKDYLEALRLAPALMKAESDPIKFLRVEDYNPWTSAKRLVMYWQYRKSLFGTRYLLPMKDDTGAGALNQNDIALLQSGWVSYVIPRESQDGRFALINQERDVGYSLECRLRVSFYLYSVASDIPAQTIGVSVIRLLTDNPPSMSVPRFQVAQKSFTMTKEAMPVRLRTVVLLDLQTNDIGKLATFCMNRVSSMLGSLLQKQMPFRVTVRAAAEAAHDLRQMGIPSDVLPVNHGGTWTHDRLFEWKQVVQEEDDIGRLLKVPWIADSSHHNNNDNNPQGDKTKEVNALYAKRAYHKRKIKASEDTEEAKRLKVENERLKQENALLESLLQQAADVVALAGDDLPDFEVSDAQQQMQHPLWYAYDSDFG